MGTFQERFQAFRNNRWLVFVAAMWVQSCAGVVYLFGSFSPIIKSTLGYNQVQLSSLGVAKNLGDSVGFMAGSLSKVLPFWGLLLVGAIQTLVGYGWIWLVVTGRTGKLPLWMMWILIFVGTNGDSYYNTASLISCLQNFPKNRGPIVGILKGFVGLSGAILAQIYVVLRAPNYSSLILMVAVVPPLVVIALMFLIRSVEGHKQVRPSDNLSFNLVYGICLVLAAYLMGVMLLEDFVKLSYTLTVIFTTILILILLLPVLIPLSLSCCFGSLTSQEEKLIIKDETEENEVIWSDPEEEECLIDSQNGSAEAGEVKLNKKKGPRRGEDFTLTQALMKADFWLIFLCFLLGSGGGLTVIDNLGQISTSLGYDDPRIFVSLISIWNFLGRIGSGGFSESIVRKYSLPRPLAMAVAQLVMAVGYLILATAQPGALYISTLLVGLGYGAHWAIVPATTSELFGLKNFGALYNFITVAMPAGSLLCSGLIASSIYDYEAERQSKQPPNSVLSLWSRLIENHHSQEPLECVGSICFFYTSLVMCGFCIIAVILSMILVYRTKKVYANLYG